MKYAIGIDLGGTKIYGILMDKKGRIHKHYHRPTEHHKGRKKVIANIVEVIERMKTKGVVGVGVGMPGFILPNGVVPFGGGTLTKLVGINLAKELEKKVKIKVKVDNDANLFALAEHKLGAAKGSNNTIGVILGTGVGTGLILNNKIYRGTLGAAGEAGFTYIATNEGIKHIEELLGGPFIVRRYEKLSGKRAHTPRAILRKGDKAAKKAYDETVFYTGLFFANLINTFNPDCIVVGGGVSNLPFYKDVQKIARKYALPALYKVCKIKKNALGDDSGVLGAAELVFCD